MPLWVWLLIAMVVLAIIGGMAEKSGRQNVVQTIQGAIDLGWIILLLAGIGALGSCFALL